MIAYIRGKLQRLNPLSVIVETHGMGYEIFIPASLFYHLPPLGQDVLLHTAFVIRENAQTLYGFLDLKEKELFDILNGIRGIGPKLALSLIGHMPQQELHRAIGEEDIKAISKIPGIGKKTAERLIVELRDKLSILFGDLPIASKSKGTDHKPIIRDALSALINLGYTQAEAQKAVQMTLDEGVHDDDLALLITRSLNYVR